MIRKIITGHLLLMVLAPGFDLTAQQNNEMKNTLLMENTASKTASLREKKFEKVYGLNMAYVESGTSGDPIVFLHGNPTSSYLWRNIIPYLEGQGRCIAPDLIGMGDSEKIPNANAGSYTFFEHRKYLDQFLLQLGITDRITFVVHDWGSALAFDWAARHPNAVKAIAFTEAIVQPYSINDMPEVAQKIFSALRSPAGEEMVLQQNSFIEVNLRRTILRTLNDEEMNAYRKPFLTPGEGRRPMLTWGRSLPLDGVPEDVTNVVKAYGKFLSETDIPKLYIEATPGTMTPAARAFAKSWKNTSTVTMKGMHYVQEDSPDEMGAAVSQWLKKIDAIVSGNGSKSN